jgi:hypothetical protein
MSWYVNLYAFALDLVPPDLRQSRLLAFLNALLAPLQEVNQRFIDLVGVLFYKTSFNGQVIYLEHLINDAYDNEQRRCYIDDPSGILQQPLYVYHKYEGQIDPVIYTKAENGTQPIIYGETEDDLLPDFIVYMPADAYTSLNEPNLRAIINQYRIAGKRYTIETF